MNKLILLLLACIFLLKGLGTSSVNTFSKQAVAIITYAQCYQRPDSNYVCDLRVSYSPNSFTLLHEVPIKVVTKQEYAFGGTPTIYFNPGDPRTISLQRYSPTSGFDLFFIVLAMSTLLLANIT